MAQNSKNLRLNEKSILQFKMPLDPVAYSKGGEGEQVGAKTLLIPT